MGVSGQSTALNRLKRFSPKYFKKINPQ